MANAKCVIWSLIACISGLSPVFGTSKTQKVVNKKSTAEGKKTNRFTSTNRKDIKVKVLDSQEQVSHLPTALRSVLHEAASRSLDIQIADQQKNVGKFEALKNLQLPTVNVKITERLDGPGQSSQVPNGKLKTGTVSETKDSLAISINADLGKLLTSIPVTALELRGNNIKNRAERIKVTGQIIEEMLEYLKRKSLVRVAQNRVSSFQKHFKNAEARFKAGEISKLSLRQMEENLNNAKSKLNAALLELTKAEHALINSTDIDISKLDQIKLDLADFKSELHDQQKYKKSNIEITGALHDLRASRMEQITSMINPIMPRLSVVIPLDGGMSKTNTNNGLTSTNINHEQIKIEAEWSFGPLSAAPLMIATAKNRQALLKYKKSLRVQNNRWELISKQRTAYIQSIQTAKQSAAIREAIIALHRDKEITDANKYYMDMIKYDDELFKAMDAVMENLWALYKVYALLDQYSGSILPDTKDVNDRISSEGKKLLALNKSEEKTVNSRLRRV